MSAVAHYHPRMMLALCIYGHANGVFSTSLASFRQHPKRQDEQSLDRDQNRRRRRRCGYRSCQPGTGANVRPRGVRLHDGADHCQNPQARVQHRPRRRQLYDFTLLCIHSARIRSKVVGIDDDVAGRLGRKVDANISATVAA